MMAAIEQGAPLMNGGLRLLGALARAQYGSPHLASGDASRRRRAREDVCTEYGGRHADQRDLPGPDGLQSVDLEFKRSRRAGWRVYRCASCPPTGVASKRRRNREKGNCPRYPVLERTLRLFPAF